MNKTMIDDMINMINQDKTAHLLRAVMSMPQNQFDLPWTVTPPQLEEYKRCTTLTS